ncbi:winged helix-turn-helix domain-containing protein [Solwaraspora sp. WMMD406]|uniref:winged helix-turn-helix domain-containing protein n=1 Tax=Solwaraspora sp. WMMD406 TaxID=3016095 RepID=UPI0024171723|nr:winged helix-turn-helix domain-containing protein [Solwaraspora sp. WMMD406]MDG4764017.1 winged helix-turn-helix domain-containing protein [Solwaraspora sp. WMMD406]
MDPDVRLRLIGLLERLLHEIPAADPDPSGSVAVPLTALGDPVAPIDPATLFDDGVALRIYPESRTVALGLVEIDLTRREFDLLLCLASRPRQVFTREQLLDRVWGHRRSGPRSVDVHVRRLRGKLGDDLPVIRTIHGVGYRLDGAVPVAVLRVDDNESHYQGSAVRVPTM